MRNIVTLVVIVVLVSFSFCNIDLKADHDSHDVLNPHVNPTHPPASHSESEPSFDSSLFQADIVPTWDLAYYYGSDVVEQLVAEGLIHEKDDSTETPIIPMRLSSSSSSKHEMWTTMMKNDYHMIDVYIDREQYSSSRRQSIKDVLKQMAKKTQVIRFRFHKTKPSDDRPFLWYGHHGTNSCASYVGKRSSANTDGQKIWIGSKCFDDLGIIEHETLHALGFYHEQSRPDRDDYIDVRNENIELGKEVNFAKLSKDSVLDLGRPYDYNSVLHYGNNYFSKNTFETIDSRGNSIGQRDAMSRGDILQTRLMYQCSDGNVRTYDEYKQQTCTSSCKCGNKMKGCGYNDSLCKATLRCVDNKCTWKAKTAQSTNFQKR